MLHWPEANVLLDPARRSATADTPAYKDAPSACGARPRADAAVARTGRTRRAPCAREPRRAHGPACRCATTPRHAATRRPAGARTATPSPARSRCSCGVSRTTATCRWSRRCGRPGPTSSWPPASCSRRGSCAARRDPRMRYCRDVPADERYNVLRCGSRRARGSRTATASTASRRPPPAACAARASSRPSPSAAAPRSRRRARAGLAVGDAARAPARHQPLFERTGGAARRRPVHPRRRPAGGTRGHRPPQRPRQALGWALLEGLLPLAGPSCSSADAPATSCCRSAWSRVPVFGAVSAPSSLAIDVARDFGITLAAFVREGRFRLRRGRAGGRRSGDHHLTIALRNHCVTLLVRRRRRRAAYAA
jgi:hypothetical protein